LPRADLCLIFIPQFFSKVPKPILKHLKFETFSRTKIAATPADCGFRSICLSPKRAFVLVRVPLMGGELNE